LCCLLFSGDDVQDVNKKLHPAIATDRQQGQDFRASSRDDGDDSDGSGIHYLIGIKLSAQPSCGFRSDATVARDRQDVLCDRSAAR
jgi:hypothetical protein